MKRLFAIEVARDTIEDWSWDVKFMWVDSETKESSIENYPFRSDNGEGIGAHIVRVLSSNGYTIENMEEQLNGI